MLGIAQPLPSFPHRTTPERHAPLPVDNAVAHTEQGVAQLASVVPIVPCARIRWQAGLPSAAHLPHLVLVVELQPRQADPRIRCTQVHFE